VLYGTIFILFVEVLIAIPTGPSIALGPPSSNRPACDKTKKLHISVKLFAEGQGQLSNFFVEDLNTIIDFKMLEKGLPYLESY
jgi:hypothetical protein